MKQKFLEWKDNFYEWLICAADEVIEPTVIVVIIIVTIFFIVNVIAENWK